MKYWEIVLAIALFAIGFQVADFFISKPCRDIGGVYVQGHCLEVKELKP